VYLYTEYNRRRIYTCKPEILSDETESERHDMTSIYQSYDHESSAMQVLYKKKHKTKHIWLTYLFVYESDNLGKVVKHIDSIDKRLYYHQSLNLISWIFVF
jgi:hypothetical protein